MLADIEGHPWTLDDPYVRHVLITLLEQRKAEAVKQVMAALMRPCRRGHEEELDA